MSEQKLHSIRVSHERYSRLRELGQRVERSATWLTGDAIDRYVDAARASAEAERDLDRPHESESGPVLTPRER